MHKLILGYYRIQKSLGLLKQIPRTKLSHPYLHRNTDLACAQEFASLLGLEEKSWADSAVQSMAGGEDCPDVSRPSSPNLAHHEDASTSDSVLQSQKEAKMAAAVECMLREVGEDPEREVRTKPQGHRIHEQIQDSFKNALARFVE